MITASYIQPITEGRSITTENGYKSALAKFDQFLALMLLPTWDSPALRESTV